MNGMKRSPDARPRLAAREQKAVSATFAPNVPEGTFEGYASLFDVVDQSGDVVRPGAFRRSLRQRGVGNIKLLYQHDAREPIGVWIDVHEDTRGLFVRGRVLTEIARGREVLTLMREGVLDGLSIGFQVVRARKEAPGVRALIDVDLWEISLVTFPMLSAARVSRVKRAPVVIFPGPRPRTCAARLSAQARNAAYRQAAALFKL